MKSTKKWTVPVALIATSVIFLAPQAASASPAASNSVNTAIALSIRSDQTNRDVAFQLTQTTAPVINAFNTAVATTTACVNCGAASIAFEIIATKSSNLSNINARNYAQARSSHCAQCTNVAMAYQFVVANDSGQPLSSSQVQQLASVKQELNNLRNAKVPLDDIQSRVDDLANTVLTILQTTPSSQRSLVQNSPTVKVDRQVSTQ